MEGIATSDVPVYNCAGGCGGLVGSAHKCTLCLKNCHIFCGRQVGEEGFGQKVVCNTCKTMLFMLSI